MRYLIAAVVFPIFSVAQTISPQPAEYVYLELVPREKVVLIFKAKSICNLDKVVLEDIEAAQDLPSAGGGDKARVRVKAIVVGSVSPCSSWPKGIIERRLVVGPFDSKMTHIHITALNGVTVGTVNCGRVPHAGSPDKDCKIPVEK